MWQLHHSPPFIEGGINKGGETKKEEEKKKKRKKTKDEEERKAKREELSHLLKQFSQPLLRPRHQRSHRRRNSHFHPHQPQTLRISDITTHQSRGKRRKELRDGIFLLSVAQHGDKEEDSSKREEAVAGEDGGERTKETEEVIEGGFLGVFCLEVEALGVATSIVLFGFILFGLLVSHFFFFVVVVVNEREKDNKKEKKQKKVVEK